MEKINYSCYWHNNPLGYREIKGIQPWNTPIWYPSDAVVVRLHNLHNRLRLLESLLYEEGFYYNDDYGNKVLDYYYEDINEYQLSIINDYKEYSYYLNSFNIDEVAILQELLLAIPTTKDI